MDTWSVKLTVTSIDSATLIAERTAGSDCPFSSVTYNLIHDWNPLRDGHRFKIEDEVALEYGFPCYLCVGPKEEAAS